jgi:hypothetical protein
MDELRRVTERVNRLGNLDDESTPRPLLTLAEFFDGNEVAGSIGCNLDPPPTPQQFRALLSGIAARPEVGDVRVQVTEFDDPDWPFSDTVWVITSASPSEVASWFPDDVAPDSIDVGWTPGTAYEPCPVPSGMQPIACWWD